MIVWYFESRYPFSGWFQRKAKGAPPILGHGPPLETYPNALQRGFDDSNPGLAALPPPKSVPVEVSGTY